MEDYKKKYEEALERARKINSDKGVAAPPDYTICETIFPELKESKDERIRKELIEQVIYIAPNDDEIDSECNVLPTYQKRIDKYRAWLEKQGENTTTLPKWKYKKDNAPLVRDSIILNKYGCVAKSPSGALVSDVWVIDYDELAKLPKEEFKKQGSQILANSCKTCKDGQKPADKVEPKFKVGDWVVYENRVGLIIRMLKEHYIISFDGVEEQVSFTFNDRIAKWTIQDAKDGDVLVFNNNISGIIICKSPTNYDTRSYCRLVSDSFVGKEEGGWDSTLLYPATKEQRDTLFKAMADAGYTFDFEKKELENIEQKSVWSEEDEMIALSIEQVMNCASLLNIVPEKIDKIRTWLKSLKDRYTWKPSDEQMEAVEKALSLAKNCGEEYSFDLRTLLEQLKAL